jgi:betaine-aldehyde dehydrogenase
MTAISGCRAAPYDAAARLKSIPLIGNMLIGGELVESVDGSWLESINPATEEYIGRVPAAGVKDVERAVSAAEKAQIHWKNLSVEARADYLNRFARSVEDHADEILGVEVADTGNPISSMRSDIANGLDRLRYFSGLGYEIRGHSIPASPGNIHFTLREPCGVVARILAFNHPINFAIVGMSAPLVAGNSVILKPSEQSPLSASILARIAAQTLPPGVLTILTGGSETGKALVQHPKIKRLSFVGSARTGMAIQRSAAEVAVKHITLELGGKNPFIVFPDVSPGEVAAAAVRGMNFTWQGQSCASTSRLFVHESIYDEVLSAVARLVREIRVGDPFAEDTQMGAINSKSQYAKVMSYVDLGQSEGSRLVVGGKRPSGAQFDRGFWVEPTVFADVKADSRIAREEIFGPILAVAPWSDLDQVITVANSVEYGLTAAVWSNDIRNALKTAKRIEAGYIWINGVGSHVRAMPYGGYKNSGVGRERGMEELNSYTEEKAINIIL